MATKRSSTVRWGAIEQLVLAVPGAFRTSRETAISLIALSVAWEIASRFFPPYIVPGWELILATLISLRPVDVLVTGGRVALAIVASFAVGMLAAVVMYLSQRAESYLLPLVKLVMAVPVICWILFAVLWFRGLEFRIFFILFTVCAPVFIIDVLDGIKNVPKELREMLMSFRPSRIDYVNKLLIPGTLPAILTSWKINLSLALRVATIAELVGAASGIGYQLQIAQGNFSIAEVFAWTGVLVILLLLAQVGVSLVERYVLRWRD